MITLPAIGETIHLHGGTITRTAENRFTVIRADGKRDMGCNRAARPEIKYVVAMNILRSHADLEPLPLPCLYCLDAPRRGTNAFCCGQHEALHYGHAPRPVKARKGKRYQPKREQPMPPRDVILEILHRIAPPQLEPAPIAEPPAVLRSFPTPIQDAIAEADALIEKRRRNYAVLDDCLARAKQRHLLRTERGA